MRGYLSFFYQKLKKVRPAILIAILVMIFLLVGVLGFSNTPAEGTVTQDDTAGTWEGNLAPPTNDIAEKDASIAITYDSALDLYEAGLSGAGANWGTMISSTISPNEASFDSWRQVSVSFVEPAGGAQSWIKFDVLCGQASCGGVNTPLPGYQDITASSGVIDISGISSSINKIRLRAKWWRQNDSTESAALRGWSVYWKVKSGASLVIYKTPNPANPEPYENPPGASNNSIVTYTLGYSLSRNVQNLTIEMPVPTGHYLVRNYKLQYLSSTDEGSCCGGDKVVWNLGDKTSGTLGEVKATFRVPNGPPDGSVFTITEATLRGTGYGPITTAEDTLTISAKSYLSPGFWGPNHIGNGTTVSYLIALSPAYNPFQGDIFNAKAIFRYPSCLTFDRAITDGAPFVHDAANHKITIDAGHFYLDEGGGDLRVYVVQFREVSCSGTINAYVSITSDQDDSYIEKCKEGVESCNRESVIDDNIYFGMGKNSWENVVGSSAWINYYTEINQDSTIVLHNFYAIDKVPEETIFKRTDTNIGWLSQHSIAPSTTMQVYVSNSPRGGGQPAKNDSSWRLCPGNVCDDNEPGSPYGSAVTWIKWQTGSMYWDAHPNGEWSLVNLNVLTADPIDPDKLSDCETPENAGYKCVINTINYYSDERNGQTKKENRVTDQPYWTLGYHGEPNPIEGNAEDTLMFDGRIENAGDYEGRSTGDAKDVVVKMYLPKRTDYLYPSDDPIISAKAYCWRPDKPDAVGTPYDDWHYECPRANGSIASPASWLDVTDKDFATDGVGYDPVESSITWKIPLVYSAHYEPRKFPDRYMFRVETKISKGHAEGTIAQCEEPSGGYWGGWWDNVLEKHIDPGEVPAGTCVIRVSSKDTKLSIPIKREQPIDRPISLLSTSALQISKTLEGTNSFVTPGETVTYNIKYWNEGTGAAADAFIIDNVPMNENYNPPAKLTFVSAGPVGSVDIYCMEENPSDDTTWRTAPRPFSRHPDWKAYPGPGCNGANVSWVMWKIASVPVSSEAEPAGTVTLQVTVSDKVSNGISFNNRAFIGYYIESLNRDEAAGGSKSIGVGVLNKGFIRTSGGDIGSFSEINIGKTDPEHAGDPKNNSTAGYLAIANELNGFVTSAKGWLVSSYSLNPDVLDFDIFYNTYHGQARECTSVSGCLGGENGDGGVKRYSGSEGFVIGSDTYTPGSYGGKPLILFIPTDLTIEKNFYINADTGVIFVVGAPGAPHNVEVSPGVDQLHGAFLVSGDFTTKGVSNSGTASQDAGRYASISVDRNGLARIVYLGNDDVRYVKCNDPDCEDRAFGFLATIGSVSSIFMELEPSGSKDLPRIVVGQAADVGGKVFYIKCGNEECTDTQIVEVTDAWYPDIALDSNDSYKPAISWGFTDKTRPDEGDWDEKLVSYVSCDSSTCQNRSITNLDDGTTSGSLYEDVGNDTQIALDNNNRLVITYVQHGGPLAGLYLARKRADNNTGSCAIDNNKIKGWDCVGLVTGSIGRFPSLALNRNGNVRVAYSDSSQKFLEYLSCDSGDPLCPSSNRSVTNVDCPVGSQCEVQDYISLTLNANDQPRIVYNVRDKNDGKYDVRLAYCNSLPCTDSASWQIQNIQENEPGVQAYTQALGLGPSPEKSDSNRDYPRMAIYRASSKDLLYVRCTEKDCSGSSIIKVVDYGGNLLLRDKMLTIHGSAIAFGTAHINRDLLDLNDDQPAAEFFFEPRYLYIFKDILQETVRYREVPP